MSDISYLVDTQEQQSLTDRFYEKDYTQKWPGLTHKHAKEIGDEIGVDWSIVDLGQFIQGIKEEMEHGHQYGPNTKVHDDDYVVSGRIAYAHLLERVDYYTALEIMEKEGERKFEAGQAAQKKWVADQRAKHQGTWDSACAEGV
ncbi:hypothetical protein H6798_03915 [Candidatus Nomurabacteria bacterium]|nr:hypothetical protein [Candidatus Nomurabacteria bacterium]